MIFVTVGTQEPFDRLIRVIDELAQSIWVGEEVIVQCGATNYRTSACTTVDFVTPARFDELINDCRFVVAHAGMGTIISALVARKPIVVVPRLRELGEHRNDHQVATAHRFGGMGLVTIAAGPDSLRAALVQIDGADAASIGEASTTLIESIREFAGLG